MNHTYLTAFTKEPIELIHGVDRSEKLYRFMVALEAMLFGLELKFDNITLRLAESDKDGVVPVSLNPDRTLFGHPDMSLTVFSENIAAMTDKEFEKLSLDLAAAKTLRKNRK